MIVLLLLFLLYGSAWGCGVYTLKTCEKPDALYNKRATLTKVCSDVNSGTFNAGSNYCFRDDIAATSDVVSGMLSLVVGGCPDHESFKKDTEITFSTSNEVYNATCAARWTNQESCGGGEDVTPAGGCSVISCCSGSSCCSGGSCCSGSCCSVGCCGGSSCCSSCCSGGRRLCSASDWEESCDSSDYKASEDSMPESEAPSNPYTPRFHRYSISLSLSPSVNPAGVTKAVYFNTDTRHGDPIGVAINGVLIFGHHVKFMTNGTVKTVGLKRDFDSCGGHSDTQGRYHYHAPPVCLMSRMGLTVPTTGTQFMLDKDTAVAETRWPSKLSSSKLDYKGLGTYGSSGSPVLGFALDGFPIHGPYNESGHLILSSDLGECNFDTVNKRYHFTPDYPFGPTCLVGYRGVYSNSLQHRGICPKTGIDNVFCTNGKYCQPKNQECVPDDKDFQPEFLWNFTLVLLIVVLLYVSISGYNLIKDPHPYPLRVTTVSVLPAFLMLLCTHLILKGFYGLNQLDPNDFSLDTELIDKHLNDTTASYLAVVGVIYSLVVAHLLGYASEKYNNITSHLNAELSGIGQLVQMIKTVQAIETVEEKDIVSNIRKKYENKSAHKQGRKNINDEDHAFKNDLNAIDEKKEQSSGLQKNMVLDADGDGVISEKEHTVFMCKIETIRCLYDYLLFCIDEWGGGDEKMEALDLLYATLPMVNDLSDVGGNKFTMQLLDHATGSIMDVGSHYYQRLALEKCHIPPILWMLNIALSTSMFFGIAMIFTGSAFFNFILCMIGAALIAISTHAIADLDTPYYGHIQVDKTPLNALYKNVQDIIFDADNTLRKGLEENIAIRRTDLSFLRKMETDLSSKNAFLDTVQKGKNKQSSNKSSFSAQLGRVFKPVSKIPSFFKTDIKTAVSNTDKDEVQDYENP